MRRKAPEPGIFAFVCVHAARQEEPILYVSREGSVGDQDSGWCFGCGRSAHCDQDWLMVLVDRYFEADPSLNELLDMPTGWQAERFRPEDEWQIGPLPS